MNNMNSLFHSSYRGMLATPIKEPAAGRCSQQQPFFEMLSKEHEYMLKRSAALFKPSNLMRHPYGSIHDLMPAPKPTTASTQPSSSRHHRSPTPTSERSARTPSKYGDDYAAGSSAGVHRSGCSPVVVDDTVDLHSVDDDDEDRHRRMDGQMSKRAGSSMYKDQMRFNPMASTATGSGGGDSSSTSYSHRASPKEKSSSSSSASSSPLLLRPLPESALLQDCNIEEETKCVVCNATFPSVWLLEQHAALQHANLGALEEKPFICDQCGQSYRYRSAYVKHREQNHRARLPADKLFTCDVCGMQFRYLKSFKKHRLNHALERLHGKNERRAMDYGGSELLVTSSNETGDLAEEHHQFAIKAEVVDEEEDQDDTVDSLSAVGMCIEMQQRSHSDGMEQSVQADEMVHSRISSSAENLTQDPCGGGGQHRQMAGSSVGMNNNVDTRNFILKVSSN